jgi:ABC-2 type transport system ATP-binding protein
VLILDEPTVGLDPVLRRNLWETFYSLAAEGKTLLVSSHVMDEAVNCHMLALMREGRFLAIAPPEEILKRTGADDLTDAFLRLIQEEEREA